MPSYILCRRKKLIINCSCDNDNCKLYFEQIFWQSDFYLLEAGHKLRVTHLLASVLWVCSCVYVGGGEQGT